MRISDWSSDVCSSDLTRASGRTGTTMCPVGNPVRGGLEHERGPPFPADGEDCAANGCIHPVDYFLSHGLRGLGGGGQRRRDTRHAAVPAAHVPGGGGVADPGERPWGGGEGRRAL